MQKTGSGGRSYRTPVQTPIHTEESMGQVIAKNMQHAGEKVGQYSMQTRLDAFDDFYHGVHMDEIIEKYKISSRKSLQRWAKDFADGRYDDCFIWTLEHRNKTFKVGNLGRKVDTQALEDHLLSFMANLDEANVQFLSSLLV